MTCKRTAGYSADMTVWQYAQLRVTHADRLVAGDSWTIAWYGPDATKQDTAEVYSDVVAELNRAGTQGWELVDVAAMDAGDSRHLPGERDWSLTRYTFVCRNKRRARAEPCAGMAPGWPSQRARVAGSYRRPCGLCTT